MNDLPGHEIDEVLAEGRAHAQQRLEEEATAKGANAIVALWQAARFQEGVRVGARRGVFMVNHTLVWKSSKTPLREPRPGVLRVVEDVGGGLGGDPLVERVDRQARADFQPRWDRGEGHVAAHGEPVGG